MRTKFLFALAPVAALVIAGCATSSGSYGPSGAPPNLAGTRWVVTRINSTAPLPEAALSADFGSDGRINGDSGCNSFSGPYIQTNSTVQIGELLSTRRACADPNRQRQETQVLAILQGTTSARLERGELLLRGKDGTLLLSPGTVVATNGNTYPRRVQFECEGTGLTVQFDAGHADLTWRDGQDTLTQKPVASGVLYESSRNTLRGKQYDLTWQRDGHGTKECRELR